MKRSALPLISAVSLAFTLPLTGCSKDLKDTDDSSEGGKGGGGGADGRSSGGTPGLDQGDPPPEPGLPAATPVVETDPVDGFGDAADDPAIWVHPTQPEKSLVLGTDKTAGGGVTVYDLAGKKQQFLALGEVNNIDLRQGFELDGDTVTLVTGTNRSDDSLVVMALDHETLELREVNQGTIALAPDSYGLCMYKSPTGEFYAIVNTTDGTFQQFLLTANGTEVGAELVREFCMPTQPEGCVADDEHERLFVGEEGFGVWVFPAAADAPSAGNDAPDCATALSGTRIDDTFGDVLSRDVEGMAIAKTADDAGYLIVSAQGKHEFVVYDRMPPYAHITTFAVWGGGPSCIDGVEETDGIDVTAEPLGPDFPHGLLVVQDGFNGDPVERQNFKYVRLEEALDDEFETNLECKLGDYGGKARFADRPPGPERTEEFCATFCGRCSECYEEGGTFSEGDCHYKSGKPNYLEADCLEGCSVGASPADTSPLQPGWLDWECAALDDAL